MTRRDTRRLLGPALILIVLLPGCSDWDMSEPSAVRPEGTLTEDEDALRLTVTEATRGTIGSATYVQGGRSLRVRGYGVVTRLAGQGSRNCPPSVREYLEKQILRERPTRADSRREDIPISKVIASMDTAVVVVDGEIPPGAGVQRTFDVTVQAVDPDTQSLSGGYLLACDLKIYRDGGPTETLAGTTCARARGPIFTNPFATGGSAATTINPREGTVIGGGMNMTERKLSLMAVVESYSTVRQVMDAINRRFPNESKVADAVNPSTVVIQVPPANRSDVGRFLEGILYLPLTTSPMEIEDRAKTLVGELTRPEAPLHEVGLALEGIGVSTVAMLQPLYTHGRRPVNFYAARTGLRLGDDLAIEVIIRHARDPDSPFRRQAVRELGRSGRRHRAGIALRELLDSDEPRIRILAYEALREVDPRPIIQTVVGRDPENFLLELVPSNGTPLIYARRTEIRRIALIGGDRMVCRPPLLYHEAGKPITLSASAGDGVVTILRKDPSGTVTLGPLKAPMGVPPLIRFLGQNLARDRSGKIEGLELDYAFILELMYRLSAKQAINAEVRWEEPDVEDAFGPLEPTGRPESELQAPAMPEVEG